MTTPVDPRGWPDAARWELRWSGMAPALLVVGADGSRHRVALTPRVAYALSRRLLAYLEQFHPGWDDGWTDPLEPPTAGVA